MHHRVRLKMNARIKVGYRVQGRVRKSKKKKGTVTNIFRDGKLFRFDVTYDNGQTRTETARAIEKVVNLEVNPHTPELDTLDPHQTAAQNFAYTLEDEFLSDDEEGSVSDQSENSMDEEDAG